MPILQKLKNTNKIYSTLYTRRKRPSQLRIENNHQNKRINTN